MSSKTYLTARQILSLKPDQHKRRELPAGIVPGLYLVIQPSGRKSWALRYRWKGLPKKITIGKYPGMSLAAAREHAAAKLAELQRGHDPAKLKADEQRPDSMAHVAAEFIERYAKKHNRSWKETQRIFHHDVLPAWARRPLIEIGRADVLRLLDGIMDRGVPVLANRVYAALSRFFSWTVERGIIPASPMSGIRRPGTERSRDRVLALDELAETWRAAHDLGYPNGPFFLLLILTAQRRGEVARMRWEHVDFDKALWTIPTTKAGRVHDVPLAPAAVQLLRAVPVFGGPYVFTTTSGEKPISGFAKSKTRLDLEISKRRREAGIDPAKAALAAFTIHDLRRTAATEMAKAGVPPHVLAAILNHSPGRTLGISAIYIRHRFTTERRAALERWAELVLSLPAQPDVQAAVR